MGSYHSVNGPSPAMRFGRADEPQTCWTATSSEHKEILNQFQAKLDNQDPALADFANTIPGQSVKWTVTFTRAGCNCGRQHRFVVIWDLWKRQ